MDAQFFIESFGDIFSFNFVNLFIGIHLDEFFGCQVASSNFNVYLIAFLYFDMNLFWSKSVHTFRFSQKQNLELLLLRISINEICQALINRIILFGQIFVLDSVHCLIHLFFESIYFSLLICQLIHKRWYLVCIKSIYTLCHYLLHVILVHL